MKSLPRWKRWTFAAVMVIGVLLATEILSLATYRIATGRWYSRADMAARRLERMAVLQFQDATATTGAAFVGDAIHPYLGFVLDPTNPRTAAAGLYGFVSDPFPADDSTELHIAVFGGSVAMLTAAAIGDALPTALTRRAVKPPRARVLNFAAGGVKQPQQLMALAYLHTLGAHFDVVVNFDGYNEIVLPIAENAPAGTFPFYPRGWKERVGPFADSATLGHIGKLRMYGEYRRSLATVLAQSFARHFVTPNVVWLMVDRMLASRYWREDASFRALAARDTSFVRSGPPSRSAGPALLKESAAIWFRASLQMHTLARASGAAYLHVLQPNQYLQDSKPLTVEERRTAYRPDNGHSAAARDGYPLLVEAGRGFAGAGVNFMDLTAVFAADHRTLYSDACCHLGSEGTRVLAERIADRIAEKLSAAQTQPGRH